MTYRSHEEPHEKSIFHPGIPCIPCILSPWVMEAQSSLDISHSCKAPPAHFLLLGRCCSLDRECLKPPTPSSLSGWTGLQLGAALTSQHSAVSDGAATSRLQFLVVNLSFLLPILQKFPNIFWLADGTLSCLSTL